MDPGFLRGGCRRPEPDADQRVAEAHPSRPDDKVRSRRASGDLLGAPTVEGGQRVEVVVEADRDGQEEMPVTVVQLETVVADLDRRDHRQG